MKSPIINGNFTSTPSFVQKLEEINREDCLSQLSEELIFYILGFLDATDLATCGKISRKFKRLTSDDNLWKAILRKQFPSLKIFDEAEWRTHVDLSSCKLDAKGALPIHTSITALKKISSLPIRRNAGVTLLTIPKGLTFNKLIQFTGSMQEENITPVSFIWERISEVIGDIPVDKTHRIAITNDVVIGSRSLSLSTKKNFANKIGCEMAGIVDATTLFVAKLMSSQEHRYTQTYTYCSEQIDCWYSVVGFDSDARLLVDAVDNGCSDSYFSFCALLKC